MRNLGVDVGGTFTDFYYYEDGRVHVHKRPSTPSDPADGILAGMSENGWRPEQVIHGSTIATNTVLERKGARTAFVSTRGFKDLLEIGRQSRPRVYELEPRRPSPLVEPDLRFEADERLDYRGEILRPLVQREIARLLEEIRAANPEAVAVCLLFSFLNPVHEKLLGSALSGAGFDVSLSSDVLPEVREFERASTTVLNAYVGPKVRSYLSSLESRLRELGANEFAIVQSSGGTLTARQASALPAATLLSGPAGGVAGAFAVARRAGFTNILTLDMGGTSTDVCLCPGRIPYSTEWEVSGLPVRLPAVDVHTVGAGGGSIAWVDEGGALRVGPRSAGAQPGPASYGQGGPPTTTDAYLVLGRLDETSLLGGRFKIDRRAARAAIDSLSLGSAEQVAKGIVKVANTLMERALRVVSVQRGFDVADSTLVAFGGAGPLHACELAEDLRIPRVLVPRHPGVLSALGMTWADPMRDYSVAIGASFSSNAETDPPLADLGSRLSDLADRASAELGDAAVLEIAADLRYEGQGFELSVPWSGNSFKELLQAFHAEHQKRYGHADPDRPVELVTLRLRARIPRNPPEEESLKSGSSDSRNAIVGRRRLVHDSPLEVPVYARDRLLAGNFIPGPAIVTQMDSTTLVLPNWNAVVDGAGNLIVERS